MMKTGRPGLDQEHNLSQETIAASSGCVSVGAEGAVVAPLHLSTTYRRTTSGDWHSGYAYARVSNPTRDLFQRCFASLSSPSPSPSSPCASFSPSHSCSSFSFPSGMAAAHALLFSHLSPGDHVVLAENVYKGVGNLISTEFERWGVTFSCIDLRSKKVSTLIKRELRQRPLTLKMVWGEVISNPYFHLLDIAEVRNGIDTAIQKMEKEGIKVRKPLLVIDGTWSTPILVKSLELGADVELHSLTKYVGGHSDLMGGVLVCQDGRVSSKLQTMHSRGGLVLSPWDCHFATRGLRTLGARMRVHSENAMFLATKLEEHDSVEKVLYPGLPSFEGHELAQRLFTKKQYGGMIGIKINGGIDAAMGFIEKLSLFQSTTSLGATESYVEPVGLMDSKAPPSMLRLSIGLEDAHDLWKDINNALDLVYASEEDFFPSPSPSSSSSSMPSVPEEQKN